MVLRFQCRSLFFLLLLCLGCRTLSTSQTKAKEDIKDLPAAERLRYIAQADAWLGDSAVEAKDLKHGPGNAVFSKFLPTLDCLYVEPDPTDPPGGRTPKFECEFDINGKKKKYKVKYDPASQIIDGKAGGRNLEVWGEVLATRLLWALGFAADEIYPVVVQCQNCPLDPWTYARKKLSIVDAQDRFIGFVRSDLLNNPRIEERALRVYSPAVVEIKYDGPKIESFDGSGWSWPEIYQNMENPESQKLQRDALTIIAAFINHMDNKAEQQRLVCRTKSDVKDGVCTKPVLMIQDAGSSYGNGWAPFQGDFRLNKVDLQKWINLKLWADLKACKVKINGAPNASLSGSQGVTEESRKFVAELMARLSDSQLTDLFTAAQIEKLGTVSVQDWVDGFKFKVKRDLIDSRCG